MDIKEYEQQTKRDITRHPWEQARLKILSFFINRAEKKRTILDIGSGDAYLASSIAKQWPDSLVAAVDINYTDALLNAVKKNKPANLSLYADLSSITHSFSGTIDIAILMDVLEHVKAPDKLLLQVSNLTDTLTPAFFIITVPAYQKLYSQHDKRLGHFKRYNRKELLQLLQEQSFSVKNSGYCFNSLLIPRIFQVVKEKLTQKDYQATNGLHNWKGNKTLTFLLKTLFWIEFKLSWHLSSIGIHIPGLTCYCICQFSPLSSPVITKKKD